MTPCQFCGTLFSPSRVGVKYCGRACNRKAFIARNPTYFEDYRAANREHMRAKSTAWQKNNPEKALDASRRWKNKNKTATRYYNVTNYANKQSPEAERVVSIFNKMGEKQRVRFADWLLKKSHRTLHVFKVDDFVSTYNSEGI